VCVCVVDIPDVGYIVYVYNFSNGSSPTEHPVNDVSS
jgi:hypothetical protein